MSSLKQFVTKPLVKLSEAEQIILKIIGSDGFTSDQLVHLTRIDRSTVDAALRRLEKNGEIQRQYHQLGFRKYFVYVSAQTGREQHNDR